MVGKGNRLISIIRQFFLAFFEAILNNNLFLFVGLLLAFMKTRKKTRNAYFDRKQFLSLMMKVLGGDLSLYRVNTTIWLGPDSIFY